MQFSFDAIGTHWTIDIYKNLPESELAGVLLKIKERIAVFDKDYSRFRKDSLVTKMSEVSGIYDLPKDAAKMFSMYKKLYDLTHGSVTPLIGQLISDAGYDAEYSLLPKFHKLEKSPAWQETLEFNSDYSKVDIKRPVLLDVGAIGKGYLIDIVGELLESLDVNDYCIDAGGDMRHRTSPVPAGDLSLSRRGNTKIKVGLEHPDDFKKVIGVVEISNESLCGSAGNRRKWEGKLEGKNYSFHHILNPHTLSSPTHILSVWVVAESTILADAMTTALFFTPPDVLLKEFKFEYVILYSDYNIIKSSGLKLELFT
jgi:thiamine biosynthesis lipoprotein